MEPTSILLFFHSLLRWAVLLAVALAGSTALAGWLRNGPVITWQRSVSIWAMVLCQVQLGVGLALYVMRFGAISRMLPDAERYWKFEHLGAMLLAVALVTAGRLTARNAQTERGKHLRVAVFYLLALVLMLAMIPWPFTRMGDGRGWL
ncbi:MAG TPA: hypothetical protein PLV70_04105 [Flavobacteriales bacterium]|nr:hypothetical protein [Flavobacteriales bacterium]HRO39165.1 hypothetical protein [Flavobacteriales bacterium]HRP81394.1 hypothetical protein [Flavobacteriales bacterium]HRQ84277.1 hypothetical protein [Flavobacteriales bacterium]